MSDSTGCKTLFWVVVVALIVGAIGFSAGFLTHIVIVEAAPIALGPAEPSSSTGGSPEGSPPQPTGDQDATLDQEEAFELFREAWNLIERDYYGDLPSNEDVVNGVIRGAVNTLDDPFTGYIEPQIAEISRQDDSGSFEGIGANVTMRDGRLVIAGTIKGQPAEKAGLRRGDMVLKVDDTPIEDMSIYEAISLIRGPAGSRVRLNIFREGEEEPFDVEIERARIDIQIVESELREDGIAYVSLYDFSTDATAKLETAIKELLEQNPKGLILDLRGNPGGWLHEAVNTAGLFLPKDELVLIERKKDGTEQLYRSPDRPVAPDIPLIVLVDGGSASASEIVAGALQDHGRAVLIGETTFGKGSVQWPHELSNGGELRVTVARWFTPKDRAIHGEGLEPDIEAQLTLEDFEAGSDPQLDRAVQYLLEGK